MAFERLIRFEDEKGEVLYGNLEKETPTKEIEGSVVEVIDGSIEKGFSKASRKATVKKVSRSPPNQFSVANCHIA
jgi:transcription initiation factor TFIIH subunit 2